MPVAAVLVSTVACAAFFWASAPPCWIVCIELPGPGFAVVLTHAGSFESLAFAQSAAQLEEVEAKRFAITIVAKARLVLATRFLIDAVILLLLLVERESDIW